MQQWEYLFVSCSSASGNISRLEVDAVNGDSSQRYSMYQYSNYLGSQGWEMVGLTPLGSYSVLHVAFKRPKAG